MMYVQTRSTIAAGNTIDDVGQEDVKGDLDLGREDGTHSTQVPNFARACAVEVLRGEDGRHRWMILAACDVEVLGRQDGRTRCAVDGRQDKIPAACGRHNSMQNIRQQEICVAWFSTRRAAHDPG